jgi:hypothetical protein
VRGIVGPEPADQLPRRLDVVSSGARLQPAFQQSSAGPAQEQVAHPQLEPLACLDDERDRRAREQFAAPELDRAVDVVAIKRGLELAEIRVEGALEPAVR